MAKREGYKSDVLETQPINLNKVLGNTVLEPKTFGTGKVGFFAQGSVPIRCGNTSYDFQLGINLIAIENDRQYVDSGIKSAIMSASPLMASDVLRRCVVRGKQFKTGSVGFHHGDKVQIEVDGKVLTFQLNVLLTAHGSKEWKECREKETEIRPNAE